MLSLDGLWQAGNSANFRNCLWTRWAVISWNISRVRFDLYRSSLDETFPAWEALCVQETGKWKIDDLERKSSHESVIAKKGQWSAGIVIQTLLCTVFWESTPAL